MIGTEETIVSIRNWLDRCRAGIAAKQSKLSNLYPPFPGISEDSPLRSSLIFHDRWCAPIRQREFDAALTHTQGNETVREAAALFMDDAKSLIEEGGPMVRSARRRRNCGLRWTSRQEHDPIPWSRNSTKARSLRVESGDR